MYGRFDTPTHIKTGSYGSPAQHYLPVCGHCGAAIEEPNRITVVILDNENGRIRIFLICRKCENKNEFVYKPDRKTQEELSVSEYEIEQRIEQREQTINAIRQNAKGV